MSMRQLLVRLTDWSIPQEIRDFHQREDIERARIVSATVLASILLLALGILFSIFLRASFPPELIKMLERVSPALVISYSLILLVFYRTAAFGLTAHLYAGSSLLVYLANLYVPPIDLIQPLLMPLLSIPIFAALIGGMRAGLPWLIFVVILPASINAIWTLVLHRVAPVPNFFIGAWIVNNLGVFFALWGFEHIAAQMRKRLDEECARFAFDAAHDPLTGLANRAVFARRLGEAIEHAGLNRELLALMYIDLNDFKPINDKFGHHAGDAVLEAVGKRLTAVVRQSDTVARLGGDEFAVLYRHIRHKVDFQICVDRIQQAFVEPVMFGDEVLQISASIGVVCYPDDGLDASALQERADALMYKSKQRRKADNLA